jgi:hypothetical protein
LPDTRKGRLGSPPPGALCLRDIVQIRYQFHAAFVALNHFAHVLRGQPEPIPERKMRLPSVEALRRELHALMGHPVGK